MGDYKHRFARILILLVVSLLFTAMIAACAGGASGDDDDDSSGGDLAVQDDASRDASEGVEEAPAADSFTGSGESLSYVANQVPFDRLIIRTVSISLTVEDVAEGAIWLRELASRKGGSVFSSNTYVRDESEFAQITIRVPSDQLDSTVQELRDHQLVVQVDSEESTSQDVSQEYVDNDSRLEALEETQRRFLALLSEADTVEDILRIESELTDIRSQIETLKGRQNYLDQMTSFSTVTVMLHVENSERDSDDEDDGFIAKVFGESWESARGVIEGVLALTVTLGIIAVVVLPILFVSFYLFRLIFQRFANMRTSGSVANSE